LIRPLINPVVSDDLEHPIRPEELIPTPIFEVQPDAITGDDLLVQEDKRDLYPAFILFSGILLTVGLFAWKNHRDRGGMALVAIIERGLQKVDIQPPQTLKRMARLSEEPTLTRSFMQINNALGWLGITIKPGDTPEQRANALAARLPSLGEEIRDLARNYELPLYSRSKVVRGEEAQQTARRINWSARSEQFKMVLGGFFKPLRRS
jgi:hypothetical protein